MLSILKSPRILLIMYCWPQVKCWMLISMQIIVHDGVSGEQKASLGGEKAHSGGVYAVSWHSIFRHFFFGVIG